MCRCRQREERKEIAIDYFRFVSSSTLAVYIEIQQKNIIIVFRVGIRNEGKDEKKKKRGYTSPCTLTISSSSSIAFFGLPPFPQAVIAPPYVNLSKAMPSFSICFIMDSASFHLPDLLTAVMALLVATKQTTRVVEK